MYWTNCIWFVNLGETAFGVPTVNIILFIGKIEMLSTTHFYH